MAMDRRTFLETNLATASAFGFLDNWGTLDQIRAYKQPNKPLLTESNLTRLFSDAKTHGTLGALVLEANQNIPAFLEKHFSTSPEQKKTIAGFTPERTFRIKEALNYASANQASPAFRFVAIANCPAELIEIQIGRMTRSVVTDRSVERAVRMKLNIPNEFHQR